MNKEIEEIKNKYPNECHCKKDESIKSYPIISCPIHGIQVYKDIQRLLSLLEKEEQAHVMSVYDLNMKIAEMGIALEKERGRADESDAKLTIKTLENAKGAQVLSELNDIIEGYHNLNGELSLEKRNFEVSHQPSISSELLDCPFCNDEATLIPKEDTDWENDMVTCKNPKCGLTDWIPYADWQRRAI